jgi:hypothetical protein
LVVILFYWQLYFINNIFWLKNKLYMIKFA